MAVAAGGSGWVAILAGWQDAPGADVLADVLTEETAPRALTFHHVFLVLGFVLGLLLVLRLLRERDRPSVTWAWLLAMVFAPWVGVPAYLLFGGRKTRWRAAGKRRLVAEPHAPLPEDVGPVERLLVAEGVGPARTGNELDWLADGEAAWAHLLGLVDGARESIDVALFLLADDSVGRAFVEALARRARAGVRVRLLLDAFGCLRMRRGLLGPLRAAGGQVGTFMRILPIWPGRRANLRNHRKLLIADGARAWTGGRNVAAEYLGPPGTPGERWIDLSLGVRGPVVGDLARLFAADWAFATGEAFEARIAPGSGADPDGPGGSAHGLPSVQLVPSGPDVPADALADALLAAVGQARRRVWIVTPYFVPDDPLSRALICQARMGRHVRLVLPEHSNHRLADLARGPFVRSLVAAGGEVLLVPDRMVHAKFVLCDDGPVVLGSANVDLRSLYLNFELALFVRDKVLRERAQAWVERLAGRSVPAAADPPSAALRWLEDLGRLAAPML